MLRDKWVVAAQERGQRYTEYVVEAPVGSSEKEVRDEFHKQKESGGIPTVYGKFTSSGHDIVAVEKL